MDFILVNSVMELKMQNQNMQSGNELLNAKVNTQTQQIDDLKNVVKEMQNDLSKCCLNSNSKSEIQNSPSANSNDNDFAKLEQNNPNPFRENSVIRFYIPVAANEAAIKIYSLEGVEIKSFPISQKGVSEVSINGNSLAAGVYVYTLFVDGKTVDTKQMVLTR